MSPRLEGRIVAGMHVREYGEGDPTVVCNSGLGLTDSLWQAVVPDVVDLGCRVVTFDRPGLGASPPSDEPRDLPNALEEMGALLAGVGATRPIVLVGHSWGGLLAKAYAWSAPDQVQGLVLVDASHERENELPAQGADDERLAGLLRRGRRLPDRLYSPARVTARAVRAVAATRGNAAIAAAAELAATTLVTSTIAAAEQELAAAPLVQQQVQELALRRPTLAIPLVALVGGRTYREPERVEWWLDLQQEHAAASTAGRVEVVERSGHFIPLEAPGAVVAAVADVLQGAAAA